MLVVGGVLVASTHPDGIEKLAENIGISHQARSLVHAPLADYELRVSQSPWVQKASARPAGLAAHLCGLSVVRPDLKGSRTDSTDQPSGLNEAQRDAGHQDSDDHDHAGRHHGNITKEGVRSRSLRIGIQLLA